MIVHYPALNKNEVIEQIFNYRKKGETAIRTAGILVDIILSRDLVSPGTYTRTGTTIIERPDPEITAEIKGIQKHLQIIEPEQDYYPSQVLHTTLA